MALARALGAVLAEQVAAVPAAVARAAELGAVRPPQPSSHVHVPLMHTPWPLQPSGQSAYWQLGPWKPGLQ